LKKLRILQATFLLLSILSISNAHAGNVHNICINASQALLNTGINMACGDAAALFDAECSAAVVEIEEYAFAICGASAFAVKQECKGTLSSAIVGRASVKICEPVENK
jgi:hypothetical protein